MGTRLAARVVLAGSLAAALAACDSGATPLPELTDPSEILGAGIRSTAQLHTVHFRLQLEMQQPLDAGGTTAMEVDADVDLDGRDLAGRQRMTTQGMGAGVTDSELMLIDGDSFTRTSGEPRWTLIPGEMFPQPPGPEPSNAEVGAAIEAALRAPGVELELGDPQRCGEGRCYDVLVKLAPEATWRVVGGLWLGMLGAPNQAAPPGATIPPVAVHVLVDQATRRLVGIASEATVDGLRVAVQLTLTNHDAPLVIVPPPPNLVDRFDHNVATIGGLPDAFLLKSETVQAEPIAP